MFPVGVEREKIEMAMFMFLFFCSVTEEGPSDTLLGF